VGTHDRIHESHTGLMSENVINKPVSRFAMAGHYQLVMDQSLKGCKNEPLTNT